jgi:hypothetical protein
LISGYAAAGAFAQRRYSVQAFIASAVLQSPTSGFDADRVPASGALLRP